MTTGQTRQGVYLGALALLLMLGWAFVLAPLQEREDAVLEDLVRARNRLAEARVLAGVHQRLKPLLQGAGADINLVTKLDQLVRARGLGDRVVQMQSQAPRPSKPGEVGSQESAVLKLDRLDLEQLHTVLQALDTLESNVWVRKMEIRRRGETEATATFEIDEIEAR
jgi:hypothetical protein